MSISPFSRYLVYHRKNIHEILNIQHRGSTHCPNYYTHCLPVLSPCTTVIIQLNHYVLPIVHSESATLLQKYCHSSECDFAETSMSLLAPCAVHCYLMCSVYSLVVCTLYCTKITCSLYELYATESTHHT